MIKLSPLITQKADQEPIKAVALGEAIRRSKNVSVHWLLLIAFSKVLQERDDLRQKWSSLPAEVKQNKKTLRIQSFLGLGKLMASVPQMLEDKICRSYKRGESQPSGKDNIKHVALPPEMIISDVNIDSVRAKRMGREKRERETVEPT